MQGLANEGERAAVLGPDAERLRLDRALALAFPDVSRARLQDLIRAGHVRRDGVTIRDPAVKVGPGTVLAFVPPETTAPEPQAETLDLDIVYEDDDLIVIDKPAGLVVHPAPGTPTGTLVNALIAPLRRQPVGHRRRAPARASSTASTRTPAA